MYINKLSIELNDNNFKLLNDLACNEIITNIDLKCDNDKIIINIYDRNTFLRLNNELKCNSIFYEVLGIKGKKEEILDIYHHLIN